VKPDKRIEDERGFSLLELLVCVVIVAIMIAVITPHLMGASTRATDTACTGNVKTIEAGLAEYSLIHQSLPTGTTAEQLQTLVSEQLLSKEALSGNFSIDDSDPNNITVSCAGVSTGNSTT
jgi:general secretion pathway protein G